MKRRKMLAVTAAAASATWLSGEAWADELMRTATVGEGPFYPDKLPIDCDNDLLLINDRITPALGEVTYLSGRVLSPAGEPVRGAFVEIWQCDNNGAYLHKDSSNSKNRDSNFQGYGRFVTDAQGRYSFRTIKPVAYPGRTPHIHFGVSKSGKRVFTTQMLINGHPGNEKDGLFKAVRDQKARDTILVDFNPLPESKIGELTASFDIVLGKTVEELSTGEFSSPLEGSIGKPDRITRRRG